MDEKGSVQTVFIPGPLPGMNEFAGKKSRWTYRALKQDWDTAIQLHIHQARLTPIPRAFVSFRWVEKNKRRDPDNILVGAKFVLDALVRQGILPDDGWDEIAGLAHVFTVEKSSPGVWVELRSEA